MSSAWFADYILTTVAPPGMSAPGVSPPGMQANSQQPGRPGGFPPNFQPPANMPNINFNAPVIRLGTTGPAKPPAPLGGDPTRRESNIDQRATRPGLGAGMSMDAQRQALRDSMMQLVPPTKEEILRTIFIGGITEGAGGDDGIERILQCAGNLRRWTRAMDADNKACRFGFAEYEDPESLATAVDVLRDVEVPTKQQPTNAIKKEGDSEDSKIEKAKLLVRVLSTSIWVQRLICGIGRGRRRFTQLFGAISSFQSRSRSHTSTAAPGRCEKLTG